MASIIMEISISFEAHRIDDPLAASLVHRYVEEIAASIPGFDPALASAPEVSDFDPPAGLFLVGCADGEVVACGGFRRLRADIAEVRRMWVSPDARGRGYGRALLSALEDGARRAGYRSVVLDTNGTLASALGLYRSAGYEEIRRYNDNPFAEHFFEKQLG